MADSTLGETDIIARIARLRSSQKNSIRGDDIARFKGAKTQYAASDSLIENVHYKPEWLSPADIACKLFARNWSDFLCKGIRPAYALLNLNLKVRDARESFIAPFLKALDKLLMKHNITLIGGDTARAPASVFTLTFTGSQGKFIPRAARSLVPGDLVVQLGHVGGSDFARSLIASGKRASPSVLRLFTRPQIFETLPHRALIKATADQSDSVEKTLRILAEANAAQLAVDLELIKRSHRHVPEGLPLLSAAEDLAVFAIARPALASVIKQSRAFRLVGVVHSIRVKNPGVVYRHRGKIVSPAPHGFEHFLPQRSRERRSQ